MPQQRKYFSSIVISCCLFLQGCTLPIFTLMEGVYNQHMISLWQPKAERGDAEAQFQLGKAHCCGYIGNDRKTAEWICKAARQGHLEAQRTIGDLYRSDRDAAMPTTMVQRMSLPNDDRVAYAWYQIAAMLGDAQAKQETQEMQARLTIQQLKEAKLMVANYPSLPCEIH